MKFHQGIAVLAVIGFAALTSGSALAGPGCSSGSAKATKTGSSCCSDKGSAMQTGSGGAAMKASGSACGAAKSAGGACSGTSASACTMSQAECEQMLRTYYQAHGWVGIESNCCMSTAVRPAVVRVAIGSPAEKAGFKTGDVLTSINGVNYGKDTEAAIQALMQDGMKIGDAIHYTALREGKLVKLDATLSKIPEPELKAMIAEHVAMSHAAPQSTARSDKAENIR